MTKRTAAGPGWRRGFLGMYALRLMSNGPIYPHEVATRLAARTDGAWKPSAGAIYPTVESLAEQGLASVEKVGARRLYRITPAGRRRLVTFRHRSARWRARFGASGALLFDLVDRDRIAGEILARLHRDLRVLDLAVTGKEGGLGSADRSRLARSARQELAAAHRRLGGRALG